MSGTLGGGGKISPGVCMYVWSSSCEAVWFDGLSVSCSGRCLGRDNNIVGWLIGWIFVFCFFKDTVFGLQQSIVVDRGGISKL